MVNFWIRISALSVLLCILVGANASHGITSQFTASNHNIYWTAEIYHFYHSLAILIIALFIIGFAITWSNQGQVKEVELRQSKYVKEKNELAEHDNRSANDVDDQRNEMLKTLDDSIKDNPEQLNRIKHIVNDWADMKIKSFKNRRSWVRNPDED